MNINLRQAIVQRVQGKSTEELTEVIQDSVGGTDQALPGLGVLFEIIWENTDDAIHSTLVQTLKDHLPH
ncbi:small acid-soluble spore protein SspI [Paenibacillus sp. J2TS4]|uniref:small acid-soluble spore protein SspI n=1 Tax=Paenibacillus sp. J2TS4 TaxID=2807194 RepID=UPI001AFECFA5|nr:small acid-soluble spore protein SspI [Paenibacillus sp. J2TS4]GIP31090.1 small, acid-soluble spore protein I [Paenibacillus sp. J2TS4]